MSSTFRRSAIKALLLEFDIPIISCDATMKLVYSTLAFLINNVNPIAPSSQCDNYILIRLLQPVFFIDFIWENLKKARQIWVYWYKIIVIIHYLR